MRKAQGALEYLIIIAAVLAIAAIVVLFLTGAFKGATGGGGIAACRLAASTCASNVASGVYGGYGTSCQPSCIAACADSAGHDLKASAITPSALNCVTSGQAIACASCVNGILVSG